MKQLTCYKLGLLGWLLVLVGALLFLHSSLHEPSTPDTYPDCYNSQK